MSEVTYLLLGSNLGDRTTTIQKALEELTTKGFEVLQASALYETEPWGIKEQPMFLNMVVSGHWQKSARSLLRLCLDTELVLGRVRSQKWGERLIDIDVLYFGTEVIDEDDLQVPHSGIPDRKFTLVPLNEIAPSHLHPVIQKTTSELLTECVDQTGVSYYSHL